MGIRNFRLRKSITSSETEMWLSPSILWYLSKIIWSINQI